MPKPPNRRQTETQTRETPATVIQADLRCPSCAGQCAFSPGTGALTCASCGSAQDISIDPKADPLAEFHYHPDLPHTEQSAPTGE